MRVIGPITLHAHSNTRESRDYYLKQFNARWAGDTMAKIEAFLLAQPIMSVGLEFHLDLDTGQYYCTKVDLGDGQPFLRPAPGQQLSLFE